MAKRARASSSGYQPISKRRRTRTPTQRGRPGFRVVQRTPGPYGMGEMKYFDCAHSSTALVATSANWASTEIDPNVGTPNTLFCPTQGSALNQRKAQQATVYKIKIRGVINFGTQAAQTTADGASAIRLVLVEDEQTNGTASNGEDIMTAGSAANAFLTNNTFQNVDNFGRYRVLRDKRIVLQNPTTGQASASTFVHYGMTRPFKMNINYPQGKKVRFNSTNGGTITDIVDHSWLLLAHATDISLAPNIIYEARVSFKG